MLGPYARASTCSLALPPVRPQVCDDLSATDCKWTFTDSVYFCTVTMSTVGYGDLSPTKPGTKVFTFVWIIIGIVVVFSAIASTIGHLIHPLTKAGRDLTDQVFPRTPVDLNGDGTIDYYAPRAAWIYYLKNLAPLFLLVIIMQLSCAGVFLAFEEWSYGDAVWHCLVTATTVGYGDMSIATDGGKWWATLHIIISVSLLGDLISTVEELRGERKELLAKVGQLNRKLDKPLLDGLMKCAVDLRPELTRDGQGLTELEFVLAMLIELGVVERGMVTPFLAQFRALDVDGTGRLGQADLDMSVSHPGARKATSNDLGSRSLGSARKVVGGGSSKVAPTSGQ